MMFYDVVWEFVLVSPIAPFSARMAVSGKYFCFLFVSLSGTVPKVSMPVLCMIYFFRNNNPQPHSKCIIRVATRTGNSSKETKCALSCSQFCLAYVFLSLYFPPKGFSKSIDLGSGPNLRRKSQFRSPCQAWDGLCILSSLDWRRVTAWGISIPNTGTPKVYAAVMGCVIK